jgi:hypothetical protein
MDFFLPESLKAFTKTDTKWKGEVQLQEIWLFSIGVTRVASCKKNVKGKQQKDIGRKCKFCVNTESSGNFKKSHRGEVSLR